MSLFNTFVFWTAVIIGLSEETSLTPFKEPSPCGDWISFKDEKCVKIATNAGHQTQQDANIVCEAFSEELHRESYPRLITVKTVEEQTFLEKLIFVDNHIKDPVWLGLTEVGTSGEFEWNDGSKTYFTNWANQTLPDDRHRCVVLESGGSIAPVGQWVKVDCEKENKIVCERTQTLTLETLQNMFYNFKLEHDQTIDKSNKEIADLKQEVANFQLQQTTVPVGFIYAELPGQSPPKSLWPGTEWIDVSAKYAGLFFRVDGGKAAAFGEVQEEESKRLAEVQYDPNQKPASNLATVPSKGEWSNYVYTGADAAGVRCTQRFRLSNGEVRPRNQAMKLWQRIK